MIIISRQIQRDFITEIFSCEYDCINKTITICHRHVIQRIDSCKELTKEVVGSYITLFKKNGNLYLILRQQI